MSDFLIRNKTSLGIDGRSNITTGKEGGGKYKEKNRWEEVGFETCSFARKNR